MRGRGGGGAANCLAQRLASRAMWRVVLRGIGPFPVFRLSVSGLDRDVYTKRYTAVNIVRSFMSWMVFCFLRCCLCFGLVWSVLPTPYWSWGVETWSYFNCVVRFVFFTSLRVAIYPSVVFCSGTPLHIGISFFSSAVLVVFSSPLLRWQGQGKLRASVIYLA